ncbi:hypothetical protein ACFE04_000725 [Oxalis oulophora]
MDPVILVRNWRKGSQWVVLTRKHAEIIVNDTSVFPMFQLHCKLFRKLTRDVRVGRINTGFPYNVIESFIDFFEGITGAPLNCLVYVDLYQIHWPDQFIGLIRSDTLDLAMNTAAKTPILPLLPLWHTWLQKPIFVSIICSFVGSRKCIDNRNREIVRVTDNKEVLLVLDPDYSSKYHHHQHHHNRIKQDKKYCFDYAFAPHSTNSDVYTQAICSVVSGVVQGLNATVFAYGSTGSLDTIFNLIKEDKSADDFQVTCSYLEVYNEVIYDLLEKSFAHLELRQDPEHGIIVAGLRSIKELISLENQELRTIEAANGLMLKLRAQLEPFRCIADDMIPWEEKSATLRLASKMEKSKRKRVAEMERFVKLLFGEDMSGSGKGVCTALAISNAITNISATVFGELWSLFLTLDYFILGYRSEELGMHTSDREEGFIALFSSGTKYRFVIKYVYAAYTLDEIEERTKELRAVVAASRYTPALDLS